MASVNKIFLMGNLTRDPELRFIASGSAVCDFGLAVNKRFKSGNDKSGNEWKEKVCFIDIVCWGKQGENCAEYLKKGSTVFVEGDLEFESWETDRGDKRSKHKVNASAVQFLDKKTD